MDTSHSAPPAPLPTWGPRAIVLGRLHSLIFMVVAALFLSFALEPAVTWLARANRFTERWLGTSVTTGQLQRTLTTSPYLTRHEVMDSELTRLRQP